MKLGDVSDKVVPKIALVAPPRAGGSLCTRSFIPHECHASIGVFAAVTVFWKMSFHTGVAAGTVAVLITVYGPWAWLAVPLVPLIGWSRVRLAAHTTAQVIAGALVGAAIAGTVFPPLR